MRACRCLTDETLQRASMKVPPKRKGNNPAQRGRLCDGQASMKVPPKRKGNVDISLKTASKDSLNESPSEKEGKSALMMIGNIF